MKALVIGGGFFGMYIARYLAQKGIKVVLCEKGDDFMQRASYANQARVHRGYHYPRSILTAFRSNKLFPRFVSEFEDCIDKTIEKYYLISRILSKVSAGQFVNFCKRIGIPCRPTNKRMDELINPYYIEKVFSTDEVVFSATKLKTIMLEQIKKHQVEYYLNREVKKIVRDKNKLMAQGVTSTGEEVEVANLDHIFNCTYSGANKIIASLEGELIPLKHEITELALIKVPPELENIGLTVMDGPFFSLMPFPPRQLHTLGHVRYTPHYEWFDKEGENYRDLSQKWKKDKRKSAYPYMIKDAMRYIPLLAKCEYVDSLWEVKTVLPLSENNDSRPILFKANMPKGFHTVVGGKIDNVYDCITAIEKMGILNGK